MIINNLLVSNRLCVRSLLQDVAACVDDLSTLLRVEPKNVAALKLLQEVQKKK